MCVTDVMLELQFQSYDLDLKGGGGREKLWINIMNQGFSAG